MNHELMSRFVSRLTEVNGECVTVESRVHLIESLHQFMQQNRLEKLAISKNVFTPEETQIIAESAEILIDFGTENISHAQALELVSQAEVGISRADGLIAETGSVVLSSRHRGDRLCSTLPEVHIVIGLDCTVYPTAAEFYADLNADLTHTLITGPSRTADIEKKLVLGAHGPRRLIVFGN